MAPQMEGSNDPKTHAVKMSDFIIQKQLVGSVAPKAQDPEVPENDCVAASRRQ
jgi:hypothetical protein